MLRIERFEQRLRLFKVGRVEAFGEPTVDCGEKVAGFGMAEPGYDVHACLPGAVPPHQFTLSQILAAPKAKRGSEAIPRSG